MWGKVILLTKFQCMSALRNFRQVIDEPIKDVGQRKVTVIVQVDVDNALCVSADAGECLYHHPLVLE